jgi:hypothetical protein
LMMGVMIVGWGRILPRRYDDTIISYIYILLFTLLLLFSFYYLSLFLLSILFSTEINNYFFI